MEKAVLAAPEAAKYLQGNAVKKIVIVPGRIINIVM